MVDSVLNRSMFIDRNQNRENIDDETYNKMVGAYYGVPGFEDDLGTTGSSGAPQDTGYVSKQVEPKASAVEADAGVISYPQSRITGPLGGDDTGIMEALALTRDQVDPKAYQAAMAELVPTRSTADIAAEYDALYADEPAEAPNYGFEKNLALARAGLALMQPTPGGTIAPSIARAGDAFVQDLAAIKGRERKDQATFLAEQKAADAARRKYILDTKQASANASKALQGEIIMEAFGFNFKEAQKNKAYMRDLSKMYYNYQYDTDTEAMKRHYDLLKEQYKKDGKVLFDQATGKFAMGYIQNDANGIPIPFFPVNDGGTFKYVARPDAIVTNFTLNNKGDFDPGAKPIMDLAGKINNSKQNLKFIREVQQSIMLDPGIIGIPGLFTKFTQSVGSTAFDIMDALKAKNVIDQKSYDRQVQKIENGVISHLKENYVKYSKDKNAENFTTDAGEGTDEYEIYRAFFNPEIPKNEVKLNSIYYALARSRKDSGRLNKDDIDNAKAALNLYNLSGSDAIRASLQVVYEEIEGKLKSDLLAFKKLGDGYDGLISDIPYNSFIGQTAGQDIVISSSAIQSEFVPTDSSVGLGGADDGSSGAPTFNENLGGSN